MPSEHSEPRLRNERRLVGVELLQYELGPGANFAYLVADTVNSKAAVVDPAWQPIWLLEEAERRGWRMTAALLTHTHSDHMGGATRRRLIPGIHELCEAAPIPVWVHAREAELAQRFAELEPTSVRAFEDGDVITVGTVEIDCLHTPGHTPGGSCFHLPGILLTGDTLFVGNIGNVEHEHGDLEAMYRSLRRIESLPHDTEVFPGHDYGQKPSSSISRERRLNAYMRPVKLEQFRVLMGHL